MERPASLPLKPVHMLTLLPPHHSASPNLCLSSNGRGFFFKSDFPSCLFTKWTVSGLTMLDKNLKAMRSEICLQQPFLGRPMFGWKKRHLRLYRSQMSKVIAHSQCKPLGFTWVWESGKGSELCIFCEAIAYSCQEISKC